MESGYDAYNLSQVQSLLGISIDHETIEPQVIISQVSQEEKNIVEESNEVEKDVLPPDADAQNLMQFLKTRRDSALTAITGIATKSEENDIQIKLTDLSRGNEITESHQNKKKDSAIERSRDGRPSTPPFLSNQIIQEHEVNGQVAEQHAQALKINEEEEERQYTVVSSGGVGGVGKRYSQHASLNVNEKKQRNQIQNNGAEDNEEMIYEVVDETKKKSTTKKPNKDNLNFETDLKTAARLELENNIEQQNIEQAKEKVEFHDDDDDDDDDGKQDEEESKEGVQEEILNGTNRREQVQQHENKKQDRKSDHLDDTMIVNSIEGVTTATLMEEWEQRSPKKKKKKHKDETQTNDKASQEGEVLQKDRRTTIGGATKNTQNKLPKPPEMVVYQSLLMSQEDEKSVCTLKCLYIDSPLTGKLLFRCALHLTNYGRLLICQHKPELTAHAHWSTSSQAYEDNAAPSMRMAELLAHGYARRRLQLLLGVDREVPAGQTPGRTATQLGAYKESSYYHAAVIPANRVIGASLSVVETLSVKLLDDWSKITGGSCCRPYVMSCLVLCVLAAICAGVDSTVNGTPSAGGWLLFTCHLFALLAIGLFFFNLNRLDKTSPFPNGEQVKPIASLQHMVCVARFYEVESYKGYGALCLMLCSLVSLILAAALASTGSKWLSALAFMGWFYSMVAAIHNGFLLPEHLPWLPSIFFVVATYFTSSNPAKIFSEFDALVISNHSDKKNSKTQMNINNGSHLVSAYASNSSISNKEKVIATKKNFIKYISKKSSKEINIGIARQLTLELNDGGISRSKIVCILDCYGKDDDDNESLHDLEANCDISRNSTSEIVALENAHRMVTLLTQTEIEE